MKKQTVPVPQPLVKEKIEEEKKTLQPPVVPVPKVIEEKMEVDTVEPSNPLPPPKNEEVIETRVEETVTVVKGKDWEDLTEEEKKNKSKKFFENLGISSSVSAEHANKPNEFKEYIKAELDVARGLHPFKTDRESLIRKIIIGFYSRANVSRGTDIEYLVYVKEHAMYQFLFDIAIILVNIFILCYFHKTSSSFAMFWFITMFAISVFICGWDSHESLALKYMLDNEPWLAEYYFPALKTQPEAEK